MKRQLKNLPTITLLLRSALLLLLTWPPSFGQAQDLDVSMFPSPDGRFALRLQNPSPPDLKAAKAVLIDTAKGSVVVDLGNFWISEAKPKLVWSSDSKWLAYATATTTGGSGWPAVYYWSESGFQETALPAKLPEPKITPRPGDSGVKLKGYSEQPVKWTSPGTLLLSSEVTGIGRDVGYNYRGSTLITIAFDKLHRATVTKVSPTKMEVTK